jgi:hypothetical protein
MAGLVPAIPIGRARRFIPSDHRDEPGDDEEGVIKVCAERPSIGAVSQVERRTPHK